MTVAMFADHHCMQPCLETVKLKHIYGFKHTSYNKLALYCCDDVKYGPTISHELVSSLQRNCTIYYVWLTSGSLRIVNKCPTMLTHATTTVISIKIMLIELTNINVGTQYLSWNNTSYVQYLILLSSWCDTSNVSVHTRVYVKILYLNTTIL